MEEKNVQMSLKLFVVLSRAYKVVNEELNEWIYQNGLNPTEFGVLELLYHKGPQPLQQIGSKILLASGSITYVVDKLEKKGLVERVACPTDRRVTYAAITEKGKNVIDEVFPKHAENIHSLMSVLDDEEKETVIRLLKKIGLAVKNLST
jgi:MarR family 2-MHQ and catechol resistance regulon transcriptional repressor